MYGYIYKTTNLINNKIYIGQKQSSTFLGEKYLGSGKKIILAINKYGKENFNVVLLDTAESPEELDEKEIFYIKQYDSTNGNIGYNISEGGRVNRTMKGENNPFYGKQHSEETKRKIGNSSTGRVHSEETRRKISLIHKGKIRSESEKRLESITVKKLWQDPEYRQKHIEGMTGKRRTFTKVSCPICGRKVTKNNLGSHVSTHENGSYDKKMKQYHLDHDDLFCKFCGKECKNRRSLSHHERRCTHNIELDAEKSDTTL